MPRVARAPPIGKIYIESADAHAWPISRLLIIWLLQQATIGSVEACHDRRFRRHCASFSPTFPRRKPASNIWQSVVGQMGSLVHDAGMEKLMS